MNSIMSGTLAPNVLALPTGGLGTEAPQYASGGVVYGGHAAAAR